MVQTPEDNIIIVLAARGYIIVFNGKIILYSSILMLNREPMPDQPGKMIPAFLEILSAVLCFAIAHI